MLTAGKSLVSVPGHRTRAVTGHGTGARDHGQLATGPGHRAGGGPLYSLLSLSLARLTEALMHTSIPSQIDFKLGGRRARLRVQGIRANDHRVRMRLAPGLGPWPLCHCTGPASCLPPAAGLEQVTMYQLTIKKSYSQERLPAKWPNQCQ